MCDEQSSVYMHISTFDIWIRKWCADVNIYTKTLFKKKKLGNVHSAEYITLSDIDQI